MSLLSALKKKAVEIYADTGTLKDTATAIGVTRKELLAEMKRSKVFRQKMKAADILSRAVITDDARQLLRDYLLGKYNKTDKNRLTAAIAFLNAYEEGFKTRPIFQPTRQIFNVITGIPRPQYKELPAVKEDEIVKATALTIKEEKVLFGYVSSPIP